MKAQHNLPQSANGEQAVRPRLQVAKLTNVIRVSLFCGGRGNANLIRELVRLRNVELSLIVNAYDDGLSTGALRRIVTGMLGPSDFRKNLSHLLEFYSPSQFALSALLEFRLPTVLPEGDLQGLRAFAKAGRPEALPPYLSQKVARVSLRTREAVRSYLDVFFSYVEREKPDFDYRDCAFGNLVFAGAFLKSENQFNEAVVDLARNFETRARLINISRGENRTLVGLKEDGTVLVCEAEVVSSQNRSPICGLYLLACPLTAAQREALQGKTVKEKGAVLSSLETAVLLSEEARKAIEESDILVFGSGTQHSSLLPSYKTKGFREALSRSRSSMRVFLSNLDEDHDTQGLTASDLVDRTLSYCDDPENRRQTITHVIYAGEINGSKKGVRPGSLLPGVQKYKNAEVIRKNVAHSVLSGVHSGVKTSRVIFDCFEKVTESDPGSLSVFVDLRMRSVAQKQFLEEFLDLPWEDNFNRVRLVLNNVNLPTFALPPRLEIVSARYPGYFSDVSAVQRWLSDETSAFLVTLSGDGEFSLRDIPAAVEFLRKEKAGAVYGSRSQSRRQLRNSIRAVYGENGVSHLLGVLASAAFTASFWFRFGVLFSDPLTGFRVYSRKGLSGIQHQLRDIEGMTPSTITKIILGSGRDVNELPISYSNYRGFSDIRSRLIRALTNLFSLWVPS